MFIFFVLIVKFFYLQIYRYDKYRQKADYNRIRMVTTPAPRGQLLDRHGKILAGNRSDFTISVIKGEMGSVGKGLNNIGNYLNMSGSTLEKNLKKYYRGRFIPAVVARGISIEQLSLLTEYKRDLPGVIYSKFPVRMYPEETGKIAAHILGYLREINSYELQMYKESGYSPGDFIGTSGLEKQYESYLKGEKGHMYLQVDALGREVGKVYDREPMLAKPGDDLRLTIDSNLQQLAESLLAGKTGSIVVLGAQNGEVLALANKPDFRPDDFAGYISQDEWDKYVTNTSKPLLNRAVQGLYPPGSLFKLITAITAMETGVLDPYWTIECTGAYYYGDRSFGCWKPEGHRLVNLSKAMTESCNVYFYQLIHRIKLDDWCHYAGLFGFGNKTGIDLPVEKTGIIPNILYMDQKYGKRKWTRGYLLNIAIGQGDVLVTPLQLAKFASVLATKGRMLKPFLVMNESTGIEKKETLIDLNNSTWNSIHRMMSKVMNTNKGTAYSSRIEDPSIKFYGKTGTAQNPHGEPHAWFMGFAIKGGSIISISIIVEHGGTGGEIAAPMAKKIVESFYSQPELTLK